MKNKKLIIIALALTVGLLVFGTGAVAASGLFHGRGPTSSQAEDNDWGDYGWMPMHGRGWFDDESDWRGQMHEEMITALADATGLPVEEIEGRLEDGEHLYIIAADAGLSQSDFFELMSEVRESFLEQAFDEGLISEEQYEWMLDHMEENQGREQGEFPCHSFEGGSPSSFGARGRGRRGGW